MITNPKATALRILKYSAQHVKYGGVRWPRDKHDEGGCFLQQNMMNEGRERARASVAACSTSSSREFFNSARESIGAVVKTESRRGQSRAVFAALYHEDRGVYDVAANVNGDNKALHAEMCLLLPIKAGLAPLARQAPAHGKLIEPRSNVLVTLQCCRMCAALIREFSDIERVTYATADDGPLAKSTALQREPIAEFPFHDFDT